MRFQSRVIQVGSVKVGGHEPIVIQSMTTTDTMNVAATVQQVKDLVHAGCQIVRITAPTIQDAEALKEISAQLRRDGYTVPLVADIHFVPAAAMIAADYVEKVRINPGNYADRKMFKTREYTDLEYQEELGRIHEKFKPLVLKLKEQGKALRIGTNHGSLSDRIMNRYGDTPEGMVESAFEFAEICRLYDFHNFCFSMKASNVGVMIKAYRLLVDRQREKGWDYPIHLGVTEAGDGEDGRIKSAMGIGTLLAEGIGDTIRVSLTEAAVKEIPVASAIAEMFSKSKVTNKRLDVSGPSWSGLPEVWLRVSSIQSLTAQLSETNLRPDVVFFDSINEDDLQEFHTIKLKLRTLWGSQEPPKVAVALTGDWFADERTRRRVLAVADIQIGQGNESPAFITFEDLFLNKINPDQAVLCHKTTQTHLKAAIESSVFLGAPMLAAGFRGILLDGLSAAESLSLSFSILQASRRRMSKTEYISCPSCGRTLFDLEETTARIKAVTNHLKGVKIAVMGCIVNGPGEMADADFGYVGGAPGRVNLYVGKNCVERNIASAEAPQRLVELIKREGAWVDPDQSVQPSSRAVV